MSNAKFKIQSEKTVNIGMSQEECAEISQALSCCLANTELLVQKTQYYHWNVTGANFYSLHKLFEKQYNSLAKAGDVVAERVRALGTIVPGTFAEFKKLATISEDEQLPSSWQKMVVNLTESHALCSEEARRTLEIAEEMGDDVSADIMINLMNLHEKSAWMLRSTVEEN